jgi:hypothetical protein
LIEEFAGLFSSGRGEEQRRGCAGNCTSNERDEHASTVALL